MNNIPSQAVVELYGLIRRLSHREESLNALASELEAELARPCSGGGSVASVSSIRSRKFARMLADQVGDGSIVMELQQAIVPLLPHTHRPRLLAPKPERTLLAA